MKAKFWICALLVGTAILALAKGDPVLMTINGKDIKLSEFEYLYHKNSQQQVEKETLEQYVDRFVLYKLKVADAEAAGIDTTEIFKKEFEGYQKDLAAPYMTEDTTYRWHFINEAYQRYLKEIDIDHFMLPLGNNEQETLQAMARMDSIRNCVLAGEQWEDLVARFSSDPSKARNSGHYGFVSSGMFPYDFENILYSTPVGSVSAPFKTRFGVHMLRVNDIRDRNDVHAKHILKMFPKDATDEQKAVCKQKMDSIYKLLQQGADFEELAKAESQDNTAQRGGDLSWFRRGRMVQPFDSIAFSLPDGAISEPFATQFGYHIIKKVAHGAPSLSELRPALENAISRDERASLIQQRRLDDMKSKYNYRLNPEAEQYLTNALVAGYDSTFVAQNTKISQLPLFTFGDKKSLPVAALLSKLNPKAKILDVVKAKDYVFSTVDAVAEDALTEYNGLELVKTNDEYRNLLNEYRDGMLLFEISNRRVWKAANKDTVGLEQYFEHNRGKYLWDEPHFKGIILSAKNDSILNLVKADLAAQGAVKITDAVADGIHYTYGSDVRMERMVVKKGENALADYLAFHDGKKPERKGYESFMILEGGVIDQPQEMSDVRGAVTSDYQDVLEQQWKEELLKKYPVKINKKVLKQVK
ncbi:MAG: peptidylprolyl isomerase [Muribaculaceae bacterium]|nr:peptidylprolyl isomerase [Muribaculaceae bacterium]